MTFHTSSRLAGLKDYISQHEIKLSPSRWAATSEDTRTQAYSVIQNWSKWAGQKIRRNTTDVATVDEVHLFPSWATKRPLTTRPGEPQGAFDVVLHVSGYAASRRTPECLTRSQRAFLKLAKGFVSIPKSHPISHQIDCELQDFPEGLRLPPRPDEISDDYEVENLDNLFRNSGNRNHEMEDTPFTSQLVPTDVIPADLVRLHENLELRLKPFWASSLSSRRILVCVFIQTPDSDLHQCSIELRPFLTREMLTDTDGYFSETFKLNWHDICKHPSGKHIAFNHSHVDHDLLVEAHIINTESPQELHETPTSRLHIPITHSILRVVSDIDDTVRVSRVLEGARAIFNQVFVKDLEDSVIPGMGEWYGAMWNRGVRFHYVSNSPFELLPVVNQFINISKLPLGSIRLRSYAGRSLFNGLLSAPATRKRGNVTEVLDQFPDSQFLLVGDSGEQDLELYSSLAVERPDRIVGIFIRDVSAVGLEDPTGKGADFELTNSPAKLAKAKGTVPFPGSFPTRIVPKRVASETDVYPLRSGAIHIPRATKKGSLPPTSYSFEPSPDKLLSRVSEDSSSSIASTSSSVSSGVRQVRPITEAEKRRWDLQNRVHKARLLIPPHIVLRVFEDPKECVEAEFIIQQLMGGVS